MSRKNWGFLLLIWFMATGRVGAQSDHWFLALTNPMQATRRGVKMVYSGTIINLTGAPITLTRLDSSADFYFDTDQPSNTFKIDFDSAFYNLNGVIPRGGYSGPIFDVTWSTKAQKSAGGYGAVMLAASTPGVAPLLVSDFFFSGTAPMILLDPPVVHPGQVTSGTIALDTPAPSGGLTVDFAVTQGDSTVVNVPATLKVPATATSVPFQFTGQSLASEANVTVTASYGSTDLDVDLTVTPWLAGLEVDSPSALPGYTPMGTLILDAPAPAGGLVVNLSSKDTTVAKVPASVTIPQSATTYLFPITLQTPTASQTVTTRINATNAGTTVSAPLTVTPWLASLTVAPPILPPGSTGIGTVTLNAPATTGGIRITLSSNKTSVLPLTSSTVVVPAGQIQATFPLQSNTVTKDTQVQISATDGVKTFNDTVDVPLWLQNFYIDPSTIVGSETTTATVLLNGPAVPGGLTLLVSSDKPALAAVPTSGKVVVPAGQNTISFPITTTPGNDKAKLTVTYSGQSLQQTLYVNPWLSDLLFTNDSIAGSQSTQGIIRLNDFAPAAGLNITLSNDQPALATVPATITVPSGMNQANFAIATKAVSKQTRVNITASNGGVSLKRSFTLNPWLNGLQISPDSAVGPFPFIGRVNLFTGAPGGGITVNLSSSSPSVASVPASVTVPKGASRANFTIITQTVLKDTPVTITATSGGVVQTYNLTVQKPK